MWDLRYAFRQLCRTPGFTAIAVLTLALGIGTSTTFVAAVDAMVFRPSRVAEAQGLHSIRAFYSPSDHGPLTDAQLRTLERHTPDAIAQIGAFSPGFGVGLQDVTMHARGRAERLAAEIVTAGYSALFNLRPQTGRMLEPSDDRPGAEPVVVISDRIWREWFSDDEHSIHRAPVRINGRPFRVVGVAPKGFAGTESTWQSVDLWLTAPAWQRAAGNSAAPVPYFWQTFVRLRPGVSEAAAEAAILAALKGAAGFRGQQPAWVNLSPASFAGTMRTAGLTLIALATVVLIAACANLTNMLLARGALRTGEVAVRLSMGASRLQVFRLFFVETALIAAAASALGLLFAIAATDALSAAFPSFRTRIYRVFIDLSPDYRMFLSALGAGVVSALAVGAVVAWRGARVPITTAIAASGDAAGTSRAGRRLRVVMVSIQVTAAVVLLMMAGSYAQSARRALTRHVTFDTSRLVTAQTDLRLHGYHEARGRAFYERLLHDVRALPGVERAALTDGFPGGGHSAGRAVLARAAKEVANESGVIRELPGEERRVSVSCASVTPGFLDTLGLPLRRGRDILETDQESAERVAIVSEATAALLWPKQDAVGKRMFFGNDRRPWTVIGVAGDPVRSPSASPLISPANLVLVPAAQWYRPDMVLVIRSAEPAAQLEKIRDAVRAIDENVAATDVATADNSIMSWAAPMRAATVLLGSLAILALAIATLGLYGVISYLVSRRTREFGIRMALGARPWQVVRLVMGEARLILLLGLLAGVFFTSVAERYLQSQLFGFMPNEVGTWAFVLALILGVGLLAAFVPARSAAQTAPSVALRNL